MSIDVVIVNWNSGKLLYECVDSIITNGGNFVSNIIVVDNKSTDNSFDLIKEFTSVKFIQAKDNLGFGKACNLGSKHSDSEFILFLNPDARIYEDTLQKTLIFMRKEENHKIGICGVQLHNERGEIARSSSRFPSMNRILCRSTGLTRFFPILGTAMNEWDHSKTRVVDQVIGAFFFVRQSLFKNLNGFDEQFFVYFEEVDFSYRAKKLGWKSIYLADAQAFHIGGGISEQVKPQRLFYSIRSRLQYCFKHFSSLKIMGVLLATLIIEPIARIVLSIGSKSLVSIKDTFYAYVMLYKWVILINRRN